MPRVSNTRSCSRSEEHTSELQSRQYLVCRLLFVKTAFPELNAWERAGADASSAGMVDAGFENQKELSFINDTATTEIYTLSLHDALPISRAAAGRRRTPPGRSRSARGPPRGTCRGSRTPAPAADRKSTRLNSSHANISYAVFCL